MISATGKRYRVENRDGENIRVYESGAEYSEDRKCLVAAPKEYAITSETASDFHDMRWAKRKQAIIDAVRDDGYNAVDFEDAAGYAARILTKEVLLSAEQPGGARIQAYKALLGSVDEWPSSRQRDSLTLSDGQKTVKIEGEEAKEAVKRMLGRE
jgi:hypothetical protein